MSNFHNFLGPPSRPGGPLEVKDITKDSATLIWKPPEDNGGSDLKYGHDVYLHSACVRFTFS